MMEWLNDSDCLAGSGKMVWNYYFVQFLNIKKRELFIVEFQNQIQFNQHVL